MRTNPADIFQPRNQEPTLNPRERNLHRMESMMNGTLAMKQFAFKFPPPARSMQLIDA